jgi:hypothetical protein
MTIAQLETAVLELLGDGPLSCDAGTIDSALRRRGVCYQETGPRLELLRHALRGLRDDGLTEIDNGQLRLVEIRQSIKPLVWASPPMRIGKPGQQDLFPTDGEPAKPTYHATLYCAYCGRYVATDWNGCDFVPTFIGSDRSTYCSGRCFDAGERELADLPK